MTPGIKQKKLPQPKQYITNRKADTNAVAQQQQRNNDDFLTAMCAHANKNEGEEIDITYNPEGTPRIHVDSSPFAKVWHNSQHHQHNYVPFEKTDTELQEYMYAEACSLRYNAIAKFISKNHILFDVPAKLGQLAVSRSLSFKDIPVADSTSIIVDLIFPVELTTAICMHGIMMQIRQRIINPPTNDSGTSHAIYGEQVIDVLQNANSQNNKNAELKRTYQYANVAKK